MAFKGMAREDCPSVGCRGEKIHRGEPPVHRAQNAEHAPHDGRVGIDRPSPGDEPVGGAGHDTERDRERHAHEDAVDTADPYGQKYPLYLRQPHSVPHELLEEERAEHQDYDGDQQHQAQIANRGCVQRPAQERAEAGEDEKRGEDDRE